MLFSQPPPACWMCQGWAVLTELKDRPGGWCVWRGPWTNLAGGFLAAQDSTRSVPKNHDLWHESLFEEMRADFLLSSWQHHAYSLAGWEASSSGEDGSGLGWSQEGSHTWSREALEIWYPCDSQPSCGPSAYNRRPAALDKWWQLLLGWYFKQSTRCFKIYCLRVQAIMMFILCSTRFCGSEQIYSPIPKVLEKRTQTETRAQAGCAWCSDAPIIFIISNSY